jgi:hypothetical protein
MRKKGAIAETDDLLDPSPGAYSNLPRFSTSKAFGNNFFPLGDKEALLLMLVCRIK